MKNTQEVSIGENVLVHDCECSVCGKKLSLEDEAYVCVNTGDVCCDSHCIYDEESNGYIKAQ